MHSLVSRTAIVFAALTLVPLGSDGLTAPGASGDRGRASGQGDRSTGRPTPNVGALGGGRIVFEPNHGQIAGDVDVLARTGRYNLSLTATLAEFDLGRPRAGSASTPSHLRMRLIGADPAAEATPQEPLAGRHHYLIGRDPAGWLTDVPTYARVTFAGVYPGIDLSYHGAGGGLEYDFIVAPGADPGRIRLAFEGDDGVRLDGEGNLLTGIGAETITHRAPIAFQEVGGVRRTIHAGFFLDRMGTVGFELSSYDASLPLVIDPVIVYAVQLGDAGSGGNEEAVAVTADADGNAYVTGYTSSPDFPVTGGDVTLNGLYDAFVTKLDPTGEIVWSTFLGGSEHEQGRGIALGPRGGVFITGVTDSLDFPTVRAAQPDYGGGDFDAFVTAILPSGERLGYSTYLGGGGDESSDSGDFLAREPVSGIAVDPLGNAVATGWTLSPDFPVQDAFQPEIGGGDCDPGGVCKDAFVTRFNRRGGISFSSYFGGTGAESGYAIATDSLGHIHLYGEVSGGGLPVTPDAFQPTPGGGFADFYVAKVHRTGQGLVYASYLGGEGSEFGASEVAADALGNTYVTGWTFSFQFPTTAGAFQEEKAGNEDAIVTKVNPRGTAMVYSTYVGGLDGDRGTGVTVDGAGQATIAGRTTSGGTYPEVDELEGCSAAPEAMVTTMTADGSGVVFSSCLGTFMREATSVEEMQTDIFVAGFTLAGGGASDAEVIRIAGSAAG